MIPLVENFLNSCVRIFSCFSRYLRKGRMNVGRGNFAVVDYF